MSTSEWDRIETLFNDAKEVSPEERDAFLREHCDSASLQEEVASLLAAREEAPDFFEAAARKVLDRNRPRFGEEHRYVAFTLGNLAQVVHDQGRYREADSLYRHALSLQEQLLGKGSMAVASTLRHMADLAGDRSDPDRQIQLLQRAHSIQRDRIGDHHPAAADTYEALAMAFADRDSTQRALSMYRKAASAYRRPPTPDTVALARVERRWGRQLLLLDRVAPAESLLVQSQKHYQHVGHSEKAGQIASRLSTLPLR